MIIGNGLKWFDNTKGNCTGYFGIDITIEKTGQELVSWEGPVYIPNTNMIDVFLNGVFQQKDAFLELSGNSIKYISQIPLVKDDVISIRYRPTGNNLNSMKIVHDKEELDKINNPIIGEVALVKNEKAFYMYDENGEWKKFIELVENLDDTEQKYLFSIDCVITEEDLLDNIIEWTGPEYIMNIDMLDIYLNGVHLYKIDYRENTPNSIQYIGNIKLEVDDVLTINYRYTKVNLGNVRVIEDSNGLKEIESPVKGSLALVKDLYSMLQYDGTNWVPFMNFNNLVLDINTEETDSIKIEYRDDTIKADIKISEQIDNKIKVLQDGLYASSELTETKYKTLTVENVKAGQTITIPKEEANYGLDGFGVLKIFSVEQDADENIIVNEYNENHKDEYEYDKDLVEFTPTGAKLKSEQTIPMTKIRDLEDGYSLYEVEIDMSKYKKIII